MRHSHFNSWLATLFHLFSKLSIWKRKTLLTQLLNKLPISFSIMTLSHSILATSFNPSSISYSCSDSLLHLSSRSMNIFKLGDLTSPFSVNPSTLVLPLKLEHFPQTKLTALVKNFHISEHLLCIQ